jgi:hypothetical protein
MIFIEYYAGRELARLLVIDPSGPIINRCNPLVVSTTGTLRTVIITGHEVAIVSGWVHHANIL